MINKENKAEDTKNGWVGNYEQLFLKQNFK